jgi:hypothetical protein
MAFISNASNFTLGEGVYNNNLNIVQNFYGRKRYLEEIEGRCAATFEEPSLILSSDRPDLLALTHRTRKRRRREEEDGIKVRTGGSPAERAPTPGLDLAPGHPKQTPQTHS